MYDQSLKDEIKKENSRKYLKPPTLLQIESFISELGISASAFERFYGVPYGTIRKIRNGYQGRELPMRFWHIIYEKIVPAYGIGFLKITKEEIQISMPKNISTQEPKKQISQKALERLSEL